MGSGISTAQREVYHQVKLPLKAGKVHFSRGFLKNFVRWLFLFFRDVSVNSVKQLRFWDAAGRKLTLITQSGDQSVGKFFPLQTLIYKFLKEFYSREKGDVKVEAPQCSPKFSLPH